MTSASKLLISVLVIGCASPVGAAPAKNYFKETISVQDGSQRFQATARHTLVENGNSVKYSLRNLFDHNKKTAWVTKFDQGDYDGAPGTFEIDFDRPVYVQSVTFQNGYQKSQRLYSANQRVKDLIVFKVMSKKSAPLEVNMKLKDTMVPQRISALQTFGPVFQLFKTRKLIFVVESIYPGTQYTDLCLSGITIHYAKSMEYTPVKSWKELRALIELNKTKTFHGGWDWAEFGNASNYPQAFNDFLYYVISGNKDAYALFRAYDPEGAAPSEDMNNYFRGAVEESLSSGTYHK